MRMRLLFGLAAGFVLLGATALRAQEISFMSNQPESFVSFVPFKELTEEFKKTHPKAKWEFRAATQATIMQNVQVQAASDALPLLFTLPDRSMARALYKNGKIVNWAPILKKIGMWDKLNPLAVKRIQIEENLGDENVLYSFPTQLPIEGFFYNKKIFADLKLEVPKTWDEFLKACEVINKAGIQPISSGGADSWPLLRLVGMYATRKLGNDAMERVRDGKLSLTDPGFVETAKMIQDLGAKGYFGPAVATLTYGPSLDLFTGGKAAIFYMTSSAIGALSNPANKVPPEDVGFFAFPTVPDGKGTADAWGMGLGQAVHMSKTAYDADPQAIEEWLKFVLPRYGDLNRSKGSITGVLPEHPDAKVSAIQEMMEQKLKDAKAGVFPFEQHFSSKAFILAGTTAGLLATGKITPEKYMADVAAANAVK